VSQDEHYKQQPECRRRHDEHVERGDAVSVIAQEAPPGWRRRAKPSRHVLAGGRLTDLDTEL
jgi:hypothetical protein